MPEPGKIAKPVGAGYFAGEDLFYRALASYPALAEFCPAYSGTMRYGGRDYVVLEDLTYGMQRPLVVDIKIGTCTVAPDFMPNNSATQMRRSNSSHWISLSGTWDKHAGSGSATARRVALANASLC